MAAEQAGAQAGAQLGGHDRLLEHVVGPGDALLVRDGSSHGMKVLGDQDLVLIITYQQKPRQPRP